jgi:hypothetical protein
MTNSIVQPQHPSQQPSDHLRQKPRPHAAPVLMRVLAVLVVLIGVGTVARHAVMPRGTWVRENPLVDPLAVIEVRDGLIVLEDGRAFAPAGVVPRADIAPEVYDGFLLAVLAQGVVVDRVVSDGVAVMTAEPRFFNTCGTSSRRVPGTFHRGSIGVILAFGGYAVLDAEAEGLTEYERWRHRGVQAIMDELPRSFDEPLRFQQDRIPLSTDLALFLKFGIDRTIKLWTEQPPPG